MGSPAGLKLCRVHRPHRLFGERGGANAPAHALWHHECSWRPWGQHAHAHSSSPRARHARSCAAPRLCCADRPCACLLLPILLLCPHGRLNASAAPGVQGNPLPRRSLPQIGPPASVDGAHLSLSLPRVPFLVATALPPRHTLGQRPRPPPPSLGFVFWLALNGWVGGTPARRCRLGVTPPKSMGAPVRADWERRDAHWVGEWWWRGGGYSLPVCCAGAPPLSFPGCAATVAESRPPPPPPSRWTGCRPPRARAPLPLALGVGRARGRGSLGADPRRQAAGARPHGGVCPSRPAARRARAVGVLKQTARADVRGSHR